MLGSMSYMRRVIEDALLNFESFHCQRFLVGENVGGARLRLRF